LWTTYWQIRFPVGSVLAGCPTMKLELHPAFKSVSGLMDDVMYRQLGGQIIMQGAPRQRRDAKTPAQLARRERFAAAIRYAQTVLADPYQREHYTDLAKERGRRADKLLTSDFLTSPEVRRIDLAAYHGRPGDLIRIIAVDDIEVVSVDIALHTAAGALLEQGSARKIHGVWLYTATAAAPAGERVTCTVTARDRPGNETTGTAVYP
jgi:hypothetical protein